MFIETETTPNPATLKFLPGQQVMPSGTRDFADPEQAEASPGNCVPVFEVADIAEARGKLELAGVEFDGETDTIEGMVSTATFYDPDRNALMLAQDLTGQS